MKLGQSLLKSKVRPYYLFQCDEVQGTEHLHTSVETGIKIMEGLRGRTSGLAIPTYVIDLPFGGGKVPLQANYVVAQSEDEIILKNYQGRLFRFRNPVYADEATGTEINSDGTPLANAELNTEKIPVPVARR